MFGELLGELFGLVTATAVHHRLPREHVELGEPALDSLDGHVHGARKVGALEGRLVPGVDGHHGPAGDELGELGRLDRTGRARQERLDHLLHLLLADRSDDRVLNAPLGHDHEGRHALDAELLRDDGRLVDVDLDDLRLAGHLAGEGLDLGGDRLARLAPVGGELEKHRQLTPQYLSLEIALGDVGHSAGAGRPLRSRRVAARSRPAPSTAESAQNRHDARY